ncbi:MAG: sulfatase [Deltaproteobacteria bacterium]|nr:sulfatase [Deltaproteobacteria bacterium]
MRRRKSWRISTVALAVVFGLGCSGGGSEDSRTGGASDESRTNLLLVSLDTVRADHTSLLGYPGPTTPRLEALASEGVFRRAYAMTSTTGPSHATLFTGRYAPAHGVARNGFPLVEDATTLAEHLERRGYRTAGFLGSFVLARRFGFAQGFTDWDEDFRRETSSLPMEAWQGHPVPEGGFDRSGRETTRLTLEWLGEHGGRAPFFVFVHYFDAHKPYDPAPEDLRRIESAAQGAPMTPVSRGGPVVPGASAEDITRYDAEIAGVDRELGALLDGLAGLGLAERTLVVVTSDHGQGLADHDDAEHSVNLYEESVRSVLVFRGPGIASGRVSDAAVEAVDVFPTILDWIDPGGERTGAPPGRSLAPFLAGQGILEPDRPVFLYRQHYPGRRRVRRAMVDGSQLGVRVGPWKYIEGNRDGRRELYHLERDPAERENLAAREPERLANLQARLRAFRAANPRPGGVAPELSEDDRARLRALGYVD